MNPVETLAIEHRLIREYAEVMETACRRLETGARPPVELFTRAVDFERSFNDAYHHVKEEEHLFVFLGLQDPGLAPQVEALRHEHQRGGALVDGLEDALDDYAAGSPRAVVELIERLGALCALLRHHLHVEDHLFFPRTRRELGADEMGVLADDFRAVAERLGTDTFERYRSVVAEMRELLDR